MICLLNSMFPQDGLSDHEFFCFSTSKISVKNGKPKRGKISISRIARGKYRGSAFHCTLSIRGKNIRSQEMSDLEP